HCHLFRVSAVAVYVERAHGSSENAHDVVVSARHLLRHHPGHSAAQRLVSSGHAVLGTLRFRIDSSTCRLGLVFCGGGPPGPPPPLATRILRTNGAATECRPYKSFRVTYSLVALSLLVWSRTNLK